MCNKCKMRKRKKNYKNRIGAVKTSKMAVQAVGVIGAAVASASDAIWQRIPALQAAPVKLALAKGALGWFLSNNPVDIDQLDNEYVSGFGEGMMYYGWGQAAAEGLNLSSYLSGIAGVEENQFVDQVLQPSVASVMDTEGFYDELYDDTMYDDYSMSGVEEETTKNLVV